MIDRGQVTQALAALLTTETGHPAGLGRMPKAEPPYYLLYSVDTSLSGAPFTDGNEDISLVYQVTSVSGPDPKVAGSSGTLGQAERLADKARQVILRRDPSTGLWAAALNIPGAKVMCRELETEPGGTSDPTDGIISYVQRFRFDLTPA
ncbi:hypothetical protein HZZ00_37535 (plasmid) [Streptomyces sp. NEAU-sy36]|uniref:hypothetical protein n=1 Tax=unclassified Streptomyces TaxID=2593676 RepID=UPI0015D5F230|nr:MULTISPECIES: hypothetical protein [unclassified Streptomyces]QLJ06739.1 hypothetical protein HZZ00_37535 [Streptomyces sp. NEAU-sy36]